MVIGNVRLKKVDSKLVDNIDINGDMAYAYLIPFSTPADTRFKASDIVFVVSCHYFSLGQLHQQQSLVNMVTNF